MRILFEKKLTGIYMNNLKIESVKEYFKSTSFKNVIFFLIFTVILTFIISSQNFLFQQIVENGISRKDIIAQKTIEVEDTRRTEQRKKEVAQKVEPILTPTEDGFIKNNLSSLQSSIIKIREKQKTKKINIDNIIDNYDKSNSKNIKLIYDYISKI